MICGRRTFELAGRWNGDHHDGVPILILTHDPEPATGNFRFFDDVQHALRRPGPLAATGRSWCTAPAPLRPCSRPASSTSWRSTSCLCCSAGADRLFGSLPDHVELELVRRLEGNNATHLRYRVLSSN